MDNEHHYAHPVASSLKEIYNDIDRQYRAKNKRKDTGAITPYNAGTVIRLKTINLLVARKHPAEFLEITTGLDVTDFPPVAHNHNGEESSEHKIGNDNGKGEKIEKSNRDSLGKFGLACYLVEKYVELEPKEFRRKIGLEDPTITDKKKIEEQTVWLLNFYDFFYTHFYPDIPYQNAKNYEEMILRVTGHDWDRTANEAFRQYLNLKKVWIEIKKSIFLFSGAGKIHFHKKKPLSNDMETQNDNTTNGEIKDETMEILDKLIDETGGSHTGIDLSDYKKTTPPPQMTECTIPPIPINAPIRLNLSLSFDTDLNKISITNHSRSDIDYFIELIENIPVDKFATCAYCGKCIIITDQRKKCCDKKIRTCSNALSRVKKKENGR